MRDHRLQDIDKAELKVLFGGINAIRDTTSKFYDECMTMLGQDMFMRKIFSILYAYLDNGLFAANAEYFRASVDRTVLIAKHQLSNTSANFNIPMQVGLTRSLKALIAFPIVATHSLPVGVQRSREQAQCLRTDRGGQQWMEPTGTEQLHQATFVQLPQGGSGEMP